MSESATAKYVASAKRQAALSDVLTAQINALQVTARQIGNAASLNDAIEDLPNSADLLIWAVTKIREVEAAMREIDTVLGTVLANESRPVEEAPV
jgi:hypothetical protein